MQIKDYNYLSKLLHKIVLGNNSILNSSFDLENFIFGSNLNLEKVQNNGHVFISGLARSGTTILLRYLYDTNKFASPTYNDMPFILSPNLWSKINRVKISSNYKYASQNPKIKVNINSPEAFEEVFWKLFSGKSYSSNKHLNISNYDNEIIKKYEKFINLILYRYNKNFYISKNNNNILRLNYIRMIFPNSLIIVPYRDPMQQAFSLLNQHKLFSDLNKKNKFSKYYMDYLGHYEFGENHKSFNLPMDFLSNHNYEENTFLIDYWLVQWGKVYSYLLKLNKKKNLNIFFIEYEKLCNDPNYYLENIFNKIDIKNNNSSNLTLEKAEKINVDTNDRKLKEIIYSIYNELKKI